MLLQKLSNEISFLNPSKFHSHQDLKLTTHFAARDVHDASLHIAPGVVSENP